MHRLLCVYVWSPVGLQVSCDRGNPAGLSCVYEHNFYRGCNLVVRISMLRCVHV